MLFALQKGLGLYSFFGISLCSRQLAVKSQILEFYGCWNGGFALNVSAVFVVFMFLNLLGS